jgi:hypothetical protein
LNEEFGWTEADRRVYELMGSESGGATMLYLNAFERANSVAKATKEGAKGWKKKPPLVSERDTRTVLGAEYDTFAPLLTKIRAGAPLPVRWDTGIFIFLPLWLLFRGPYLGMFAIWVVAMLAARFSLQGNIPYGEWPLARIIGCLPLLGVHLWGGAFAYRLKLSRALAKIAKADRDGLFDPDRRRAFLHRYAGKKRVINVGSIPWWIALWLLISGLLRVLTQQH